MEKKPWCMPLIKQLNTEIRNNLNNNLKNHDITGTQFEVLVYLHRNPTLNVKQRDLEEKFHLSNPTIVSVLDRLEKKNLVLRTCCEKDKRIKYLKITKEGDLLCDSLYDYFCKVESHALKGFTPEEEEIFQTLLKKVLDNFSCGKGDR